MLQIFCLKPLNQLDKDNWEKLNHERWNVQYYTQHIKDIQCDRIFKRVLFDIHGFIPFLKIVSNILVFERIHEYANKNTDRSDIACN